MTKLAHALGTGTSATSELVDRLISTGLVRQGQLPSLDAVEYAYM